MEEQQLFFSQLLREELARGAQARGPAGVQAYERLVRLVRGAQAELSSTAAAVAATANTTLLEVQTESECGQCSICLKNYTVGTILRQLPCGHKFDDACVSEWIKKPNSSRNCPLCRYQL